MNLFKQAIWSNFWEKNIETDIDILIEHLIKEAASKVPHNKLEITDKLKIKRIDLDFTTGKTLIQFNQTTNIIDLGTINDMTCFISLINIEYISISYFFPKMKLDSVDELELESSLKRSNLFNCFSKLKKVELNETSLEGTKSIEIERGDVLPF